MNKKRLGQFLIGGVFTVCGLVITALAELVAKEDQTTASAEHRTEESE